MVRMPLINRRVGSALAMAFALAAGGVAGNVALTAPALAQQQPQYSPSRNFSKIYQPIAAIANADGADYASAKAQLPALVAAIENADDRFLAGNLHYALGVKLNDQSLQQQGMELMLASGKAPPAAVAEMRSDRNAIASTISVTPTMKRRKSGSRSMIWSAMSLNAAVWPETYACASPPWVAAGTTSSRSRSTSSPVASSCGAEAGVTKTIPTVPSSFSCGSPTDATPWSPRTPS